MPGSSPPAVIGRGYVGYPDERWLDIRQPVVRTLIARRVAGQCQRKRFDAVEFDNIAGYSVPTGFPLTTVGGVPRDPIHEPVAPEPG